MAGYLSDRGHFALSKKRAQASDNHHRYRFSLSSSFQGFQVECEAQFSVVSIRRNECKEKRMQD